MNYDERALYIHERFRGKIEIKGKTDVKSMEDLSVVYTPGVAAPCRGIYENPKEIYRYTNKQNTVAIVTDGSAVLGLGNIGAEASIPVMEGKALLFKTFAGIDAVPICLRTQDSEEMIKTIKEIAPVFGGINLEDIAAPRCFEIEKRLQEELDIPVFHDDQHGTAIVVTAALLNASEVAGKRMETLHVVINGAGAAGTAIAKMLLSVGVKDLIVCDKAGALCQGGTKLPPAMQELASITNPRRRKGNLEDILEGADVFIGVSAPGVLTADMIRKMAQSPILFPMANPEPEIWPEEALQAGARIIGTGRSDYPNQINNVLAFPGVFKGALQVGAERFTEAMKIAAAKALADAVPEEQRTESRIIPDVFWPGLSQRVADAVAAAWKKEL